MNEWSVWILIVICVVTLALVIGLWVRKDQTITKNEGIVINDNAEVLKAIEGARQQMSTHNDQVLGELRFVKELMIWMKAKWNRFSK